MGSYIVKHSNASYIVKHSNASYIVKHSNASYRFARRAESVSTTVTIKLPDGTTVASKSLTINGTSYTTNASGQVTLTGEKGTTVGYYLLYGNYSKGVEITFDGNAKTITMDGNYQFVTIKKADGTVVASKTVTIGGTAYTTNASGVVTITGDYGTSKSLLFKLDNNNYKTQTITFNAGSTTVTLEAHVVGGSVSVGSLGTSSSASSYGTYSFTVPTYVKVIKVTGSCYDGNSDEATDYGYIGTTTSGSWNPPTSSTIWYSGTRSFTIYVGVTPGKTITIYGRWVSSVKIEYSDSINTQTPTKTA